MAQKKEHSYKAAASGEVSSASEVKYTQAKPVGNATGLRIGAVLLWLCAFAPFRREGNAAARTLVTSSAEEEVVWLIPFTVSVLRKAPKS